jgi:hypothetical protein
MSAVVARRSVTTASRMGRASVEAPTESILELAKQDLNTKMRKAKVGYKYGFRQKSSNYSYNSSDYSYSYNLNLESSFSLRGKNLACDTRNIRGSRVAYPRNTSGVERSASNTRESRVARDKFKPANRFTKGPAPRCHGKAFKRESLLRRGINKVKKSLFGLKVVPRRLAAKQSPVKKCLNAYGFDTRTQPGTKSTNMATASRADGSRNSTSKIPVPVSSLSRRKHLRSFLMDNTGSTSTSMTSRGHRGTVRGRSSSGHENTRNLSRQEVQSGEYFYRRYPNPREVSTSYSNEETTKYPSRNSTGMLEAHPRGTGNLLTRDYHEVLAGEGRGDSWDGFGGQRVIFPESSSRKQENVRPSLIGVNPKTSREVAVVAVDSPMSSHGSWEGYECENEATSEHVRPASGNVRPLSDNFRPVSENRRPLSENLPRTLGNVLPTSESVRPKSLELDEKVMSLPERRSRLEKDLDALMASMEKVLGSPVSPVRDFNPGTWPRKMSREKSKGMSVRFGRPVFEAVI